MTDFTTSRGRPLPLGVSPTPDGANFVLLCRHGTDVRLLILPPEGGSKPLAEFRLDGRKNRTGDHWHWWPSSAARTSARAPCSMRWSDRK